MSNPTNERAAVCRWCATRFEFFRSDTIWTAEEAWSALATHVEINHPEEWEELQRNLYSFEEDQIDG